MSDSLNDFTIYQKVGFALEFAEMGIHSKVIDILRQIIKDGDKPINTSGADQFLCPHGRKAYVYGCDKCEQSTKAAVNTSEHECGGRTDGYGGFTCVKCGHHYPKAHQATENTSIAGELAKIIGEHLINFWHMESKTSKEEAEEYGIDLLRIIAPHLVHTKASEDNGVPKAEATTVSGDSIVQESVFAKASDHIGGSDEMVEHVASSLWNVGHTSDYITAGIASRKDYTAFAKAAIAAIGYGDKPKQTCDPIKAPAGEGKTPSSHALDPDMPAQELRLHMGEMTRQEDRTARAAMRWANSHFLNHSNKPAENITEKLYSKDRRSSIRQALEEMAYPSFSHDPKLEIFVETYERMRGII